LADLARVFATEVRHLGERCAALLGRPDTGGLAPAAYVLVDRYCLLIAAASCLAVRENADPAAGDGGLLAEPDWALLALTRFGRRLGLEVPDLPDGVARDLAARLVDRYRDGRSFDLYGMRLT
ncbi:acyl-CoA dehydrogenase, partial [Streptomyces coelicoflavus]|nr:acyl-CoA dehydrogenase [Streptomyces coelicoflavus]